MAEEMFQALPAGYNLQEYRIESTLGSGGFGLTYLAHDANLNTKVAIKEYLPPDFAARGEDHTVQPRTASARKSFDWGLKRFLEESRTLASFHHPNIVRVMRFFEANRTAYMVMEFIAGKPLNEWVQKNLPLTQVRLMEVVLPLLNGLEVIHKAGYLHRDIKPPNIFVRDDESPVLIDFGSARMKVDADQSLTAIVTPGFAPLEQYHAYGKQGPWTDIYAFGGVLYWLLTGKKPVEATARVREDIMPSASDTADRTVFSAPLLAAIDWALRPHEGDRPQSVAAWRDALTAARAIEGATVIATPSPVAPMKTELAGSVSVPSGSVFDPATLKRMEGDLAPHVGPIAAIIVRNAAKKATSASELAKLLAPEIPREPDRTAFIKRWSSDTSIPLSRPQGDMPATGASDKISTSALQKFGEETLRRAEMTLAQYIGAVARVVVKRAAQKARDESELYLLLADEIEDKNEKKNFIRKALSVARK